VHYVLDNWSFDPFLVVIAAVVVLNEVGLARLRARSVPARTRRRRGLSLFFYAGLAVLVVAVSSPIDYWASDYFWVHMTEHLLLAFYAPLLIVAGAPWLPLAHGFPVSWRRGVGRFVLLGPWSRGLRAIGRVVGSPWFAVLAFNGVMVLWHLPAFFDAAEENQAIHVGLMHASLFATGILFWLLLVPSRPFRMKASATFQVGAILATNVVMFVLAMSMSIFSSTSWYDVYAHVPGVTLSPFADQQLGAAILWVCGDLWALPALTIVIRRAMDREGGLADAVDRIFHRAPTPDFGEFRGLP
jgi:putative membrane protein